MTTPAIENIGLITSGGDCGGLNAVLKGAALTADARGVGVLVIPNGYAGLYNLVDMERVVRLTPTRLDAVRATLAGSEAGHSRVKISKIEAADKYERIKQGLAKHGIDGLVISGGDDTGSVIVDLAAHGIRCVHAPKTMDLDLQTYSVGGDSTVNRIAQFVHDLRTTAITHNRVVVVEVFGRYAGHTAFRGGIAAEADCILMPEVPVDFRVVYEHFRDRFMRRVRESDVKAGTYMIVVAEGIRDEDGEFFTAKDVSEDPFGHKKLGGAGKFVQGTIEEMLEKDAEIERFMKDQGMYVPDLYERPEVRTVTPTHLVRCGETSAYDVNFGMQAGAAAVSLLLEDKTAVTVVDVQGGRIQFMPTERAIEQRHVDVNQVALFEQMGFCFGRKAQPYEPSFAELAESETPARHL